MDIADVRRLCLTSDADGWYGRHIPDRIHLQSALADTFETACLRSGFTMNSPWSAFAHGVRMDLRGGDDPAADVPALIRELRIALIETNPHRPGLPRLRVRLALTMGPALPPGIPGRALAEGLRLLYSEQVRVALSRLPQCDLTVIVSDAFYHDVVNRGFLGHRPVDYHRIRLGAGFPSSAWVYVPGWTTNGPPARPRAPLASAPHVETLMSYAGRLLREGEYSGAAEKLEEALRFSHDLDEPAVEEALLSLGECRRLLGDAEAAAQTWLSLLACRPTSWPALQRLGRLELLRGRADLARVYLAEGLRVLKMRPEPGVDRFACALLLDLASAFRTLNEHGTSDACLNAAAEADPPSPLPFVSLAYRAAERGDTRAARRLLFTALLRVSGDIQDFVHTHFASAASQKGGDVIIELLLENDLDPVAPHRTTNSAPAVGVIRGDLHAP
ncbi:tetratricopeptide repeat protein [Sphaerisporangium corydalis]|uniref:Tetratricopeptide repeat protein n=1 Tax=Sphaerisporangium corydalis TaxID=1441875 RepID=A0ABV9ENI6_9ACTN|nr:tetratricopeptide repeat protein [Sphaerisporangium corydalis]